MCGKRDWSEGLLDPPKANRYWAPTLRCWWVLVGWLPSEHVVGALENGIRFGQDSVTGCPSIIRPMHIRQTQQRPRQDLRLRLLHIAMHCGG